jgi:hypothetical protein
MVDPYAPPMEGPAPARPPAAGTGPYSSYEPPQPDAYARPDPYARPEASESPRERRLRHERDASRERGAGREAAHGARPEPARPGAFWSVAAVGVGILGLARLVGFFAVQDDVPDDRVAPLLLATLGAITLSAGLALAAVLQRGLEVPWRAALLLGAGFFAVVGLLDLPGFGFL